MTPNHNEELRERIADYVEGIRTPIGCLESPIGLCFEHRPIQLADVLRAISLNHDFLSFVLLEDGILRLIGDEGYSRVDWNLAAGLDGQTEEVKEFLWKIICSPK